MKKTASVVVVTYNRPKDLKDTVTSLINQSVTPFEVIVIDNGSNPHLNIDFQDKKRIKLIRFDKEVGLSNARNYGINVAKGEYIAFMDDDAVADKYWMEEIQKKLGVVDILGGPIRPLYEASPPEWWSEKNFGIYVGVGNSDEHDIWGSNIVVRKEVFGAIGLFNPNIGRQKGKLLSFEDREFCDRARRNGYSFRFMSDAVVYHKVPPQKMTFCYIMRWSYNAGKSQKIYEGYQPLRSCVHMLSYIKAMTLPHTIVGPDTVISKKSTRIKRISGVAWQLGRLF